MSMVTWVDLAVWRFDRRAWVFHGLGAKTCYFRLASSDNSCRGITSCVWVRVSLELTYLTGTTTRVSGKTEASHGLGNMGPSKVLD